MRKLSKATLALATELEGHAAQQHFDALPPLLAALGASGEPAALAVLLPYLLASPPSTALAARQAAGALLATTPQAELGWLEQEIRSRSRRDAYYYRQPPAGAASEWRGLTAAALKRHAREPGGAALLQVASFHDSGFVREAAIRAMDADQSGDELPYLLLRLNDWVPVIHHAARGAIERRLEPDHARHFLTSIALCQRLAEQRRNALGPLHEKIQALLRSPAAAPARLQAEGSPDRHVRRAAFLLSAESPSTDDAALRELLLRALGSGDLWVRIWATRTARTRLYGPALRETLGQARGDRSVPVRREALLGFVEEFPELRRSLLDPCASLREMVRYYLRKKANLDFAAIYRQELERLKEAEEQPAAPRATTQLITALAGLGETGGEEDADRIELFTIDDRPRVQQAALTALGRLAGERSRPTLAAALGSPYPSVCRAALAALGPHLPLVGAEALWRAYSEQPSGRCRFYLVKALGQLPRWVGIRYLLAACGDPDPGAADEALRLTRLWLAAPNYVAPAPAEKAALEALLPTLPRVQGEPELRSRLEWTLAPWRQS